MKRGVKWLLGVAVGGGLLVLGTVWLVVYFVHPPVFGIDTDTPTTLQIEGLGHFKLPGSARNIHAHAEGFQDHGLWAVFEMAPSDEAALWASSLCKESPANVSKKDEMVGIARPWWHPWSATSFVFREKDAPSLSQRIFIDTSNSEQFVVYVETLKL